MADRKHGVEAPPTESEIRQADWYGEDLSRQEHTRVAFIGVDLTEATDEGAVFTECTFRDCRFNLSQHTEAAFLNCTFTGCSFFQATFTDCKLVGSMFDRCSFDLLTVTGGDWSFVGLPGRTSRGPR
ncbi:pentapeptide repeat-containing protein [Blastococcus brunescens]|uniref:Pentapeptide repeat-containing protein n=1 Tax=Blastococcus brunescens TaxID=1564165 RepID=A0ABZ1AZI8_9ACTN|nr:pentapeptide repeat-containing protein [Blastococcus sp. BMG 8361]WRL63336.1 pentapeptide repeat-containing protein [Blastococcus sp. BMG 8361]